MKIYLIIIISIVMSSCNNEKSAAEKAEEQVEKMIAEANAKAAKLIREAEERAEANVKMLEEERKEALQESEKKKLIKKESLEHQPDKSLSKYNGLYQYDKGTMFGGVLIFIDGKLVYFDCRDYETTYKNEEYNISGITEEGFFNIKAKYFKDRNGNIAPKETVLYEGKPIIESGECVRIERLGYVFTKCETFRDFMTPRNNYTLENLIEDVKKNYNRSKQQIVDALSSSNFYMCKAFQKAEFYGEKISYSQIVNSIIELNE